MPPAALPSDAMMAGAAASHSPPEHTDVISDSFTRALDAARPFEPRPHLAVAVSGGADSMALLVLADRWARARRGRATALTVDHGLRADAAEEARQVGRWCQARGIAHVTLTWRPPEDLSPGEVQAVARVNRYRLMADWCRSRAVLHLLTAHHRDDQAETFLLRLGRHSGLDGLAGMALVRDMAHARLIRPLLGVPRAHIEAFLADRGQDWIEDPSNRDPRYARVRLRALLATLDGDGFGAGRQARLAGRFGRVRVAMDLRVARVLADAAAPHPAGFVRLDRDILSRAGPELGQRALARVLATVSGGVYPVRGASLSRLYDALVTDLRARTLGGCRVIPERGGRVAICREARAVAPPLPVQSGTYRWDGRYRITVNAGTAGKVGPGVGGAGGPVTLGALGSDGWTVLCRACPELHESVAARAIPAAARVTLPALRDARGLLEVPYFGYRRSLGSAATLFVSDARPDVPEPLAGSRFGAAPGNL